MIRQCGKPHLKKKLNVLSSLFLGYVGVRQKKQQKMFNVTECLCL